MTDADYGTLILGIEFLESAADPLGLNITIGCRRSASSCQIGSVAIDSENAVAAAEASSPSWIACDIFSG
jgi:hypothetical protein